MRRGEEDERKGLRCRPGDLAIVTRSGVAALLGLLVEVVAPAATGEHDWLTEIQGEGVVAPGAFTGAVTRRTRALMLDAHLAPLTSHEGCRQTVQMDREACVASAQTSELARRLCLP